LASYINFTALKDFFFISNLLRALRKEPSYFNKPKLKLL